MDESGRFDFWRMLLCTRAVTPPDAREGLRRRVAQLSVPSWLVLTVIATLGIGAAVYISNPPSKSEAVVIHQTTTTVAATPAARPSRPW